MFTKSILFTALGLATAGSSIAQNNLLMKNINEKAPVTASKQITIQANSETVWNVLSNINQWAAWNKDISQPKLNDGLKPGSTFEWKTGGAKIHSTLHIVEKARAIGWTGKALGAYAIHNWTLSEQNGQTTVVVTESIEGFLVKLFKKSFAKSLETGMQNWLEFLKKECEVKAAEALRLKNR